MQNGQKMTTPKILIVDDDPTWCEGSLKTPLLNLKCQVSTTQERSQALALMQDETFDIVVLNVRLSFGEDSTHIIPRWAEVLDLINQREAEAIVVASRSFPADIQIDKLVRMAFRDFGVVDFMVKEDFNQIEYLQRIQDAMKKRPSPISWERWQWKSTDGKETIPQGVIRDILLGLGNDFPETGFSDGYRDIICSLAVSHEDRRIQSAVRFWERLWAQERRLPYSPLMKLLAKTELSGQMYPEYRDHVAHSIWMYLLGLYLYQRNASIREAILAKFSEVDFLSAWKIAALFHDIGYTFDKGIDREDEFLRPILNELQRTIDFPLRAYLQPRGVNLSEAVENELMGLVGRFTPKILSLDDLEFSPAPGPRERLLARIENWAIPTLLAQRGHETPFQNIYFMGKTVKPKNRDRFRDHGILSALILLYQFHCLDLFLQGLEKIELPRSLNEKEREGLQQIIAAPAIPPTKVLWPAAAAMALHNINVEIWDTYKARQEPYYLNLEDYRIDLEETPLGFLLAVTDVLQCWDRPKRRYEDKADGLSVRSQDVHIECNDDVIFWSVESDSAKYQPLNPDREINSMSKYMAYKGNKNLSPLIKEKSL
jgi:CheY-like chemotaxis protein